MSTPLETVERETGVNPQTAIIWLHGLGADAHDFEPIVPSLALGPDRPLRFVFPHAPMRPITMNGGVRMRAWFDIIAAVRDAEQDSEGIWKSVEAVQTLIARENGRGIPSQRILLAGFSQGGTIALITALTHEQELAGVIALSTFLPIVEDVEKRVSPANRNLDIFMAHGQYDGMVSFRFARNSRRKLSDIGARITWREYPIDHGVAPDEIEAIRSFLDSIVVQ